MTTLEPRRKKMKRSVSVGTGILLQDKDNRLKKSVSFGGNTIHEIENLSLYIRERTFPEFLERTRIYLAEIVEQFKNREILSVSERIHIIKCNTKKVADQLVHNRDVLSVKMRIKGEKDDDIPRENYNRIILIKDFTEILLASFKYHKNAEISYGHTETILEFDVSPFPPLTLEL